MSILTCQALEGTLYYDYTSKNDYGGRVSDTTRYYRNSSPRISQITFVPADGFSGTVTISYTGYDTAGESFTGNVIIRLADETVRCITPQEPESLCSLRLRTLMRPACAATAPA